MGVVMGEDVGDTGAEEDQEEVGNEEWRILQPKTSILIMFIQIYVSCYSVVN